MCQKSIYLNREKTYDQPLVMLKKHDQDDASKPNERRFQPFPRQQNARKPETST